MGSGGGPTPCLSERYHPPQRYLMHIHLSVSVLVSVGFVLRCALMRGRAGSGDASKPMNTGVCVAVHFPALRCNESKMDFESAASASSAIPA